MHKKVSVIIPIYNATEKQLEISIGSVVNQTYDNVEIVAVNDCSTSTETYETLTLIENRNKEREFIVYTSESNRGISCSRNKGMFLATGDFICFLDQDDYFSPDFVEKLVIIAEEQDADVAMCGFDSVDESGNIISIFPKKGMDQNSAWYPWSVCAIWNRIYKKRFLEERNIIFPEGCVTEDIVFLMQCNTWTNKIAIISDVLYHNVSYSKSTSRSKSFHALEANKMPIKQIEKIVNETVPCSPYIHAYVCNEMALLCNVLTTGTNTRDISGIAKDAGYIIRIASRRNSIKGLIEYNHFCKDKRIMQVLIVLIYLCSLMRIEKQYVLLFHVIGKRIRK